MKTCPECGKKNATAAIGCPYCGLVFGKGQEGQTAWYWSTLCIVGALLVLGPLALPLVWRHPHYTASTKTTITVVVIALGVVLSLLTCTLMWTSTLRGLPELPEL